MTFGAESRFRPSDKKEEPGESLKMTKADRVIVTGGTGFIGRPLCARLKERGYAVTVLSRRPDAAAAVLPDGVNAVAWDGRSPAEWSRLLEGAAAVINLAGDNLASGRWTKRKRTQILDSRLNAGRAVSSAVAKADRPPRVCIQASAVGYYDHLTSGLKDETASLGRGFLSSVCRRWESSTSEVEEHGVRRVILRSALVLGRGGGVLSRYRPQFRYFLGGYFGCGRRFFPWIHMEDEIRAILFLMEHPSAAGPFNLTAPEAVTMKRFARTLGAVMKRPSFFPIPPLILKAVFGRMADEALLADLQVSSKKLENHGFQFRYFRLREALESLLKENITGTAGP